MTPGEEMYLPSGTMLVRGRNSNVASDSSGGCAVQVKGRPSAVVAVRSGFVSERKVESR